MPEVIDGTTRHTCREYGTPRRTVGAAIQDDRQSQRESGVGQEPQGGPLPSSSGVAAPATCDARDRTGGQEEDVVEGTVSAIGGGPVPLRPQPRGEFVDISGARRFVDGRG